MRILKAVALLGLAILPTFAADVPRKAPEFVIQTPKGQLLLSQYQGKVVVLEFILTTCPHCQHASQMMTQLQNEYGPKGFQALGVAFNDMANMLVADFVRDFKINYPVGFSSREPVYGFLQQDPNYSLHVPNIVIIDRKGMIRHQSLPRDDRNTATEAFLRPMIEKLLAESSGKAATKPVAKKKTT